MITLHRIYPERGYYNKNTYFSIFDRRSYFIKKYHIFDPKKGCVIVKDIDNISEKNNPDIEKIELGSETNSLEFITGIPCYTLTRKNKPDLRLDNIFYIPSGTNIRVKNYFGSNKKTFTRGYAKTCELYLPVGLFAKIKKHKDVITYYLSDKIIKNKHSLYYKNYNFIVTSNCQEILLEKNEEFKKDIQNIFKNFDGRDIPLTTVLKNKVIEDMHNFIKKYENFKVER